MRKRNLTILLAIVSVAANAQFGKLLKKGDSGSSAGDQSLPKGIELYTGEHSDSLGISGKYYMLYPVYLESKNMMNMPKGFTVDQVTIEYRPKQYTGVFHYVNDEPANQIRYKSTNLSEINDFTEVGAYGTGRKYIEKFKSYYFIVKNNNQFMPGTAKGQSFRDGVLIFRYSKDPDIILVGNAKVSSSKGCVLEKEPFDFWPAKFLMGAEINVLCKDKNKLAGWDSTKIKEVLMEEAVVQCKEFKNAAADVFDIPKQVRNDNALEKECFDAIKPAAAQDKPLAWGDKLDYVYLSRDWTVYYKDAAKKVISHRTCIVIAVSKGWPDVGCQYIPIMMKQFHDGSGYGKSVVSGFQGALVPVSCDAALKYKD